MAHRTFIVFLVLVGLTAVIAIGLHGMDYYLTPLRDRPFRTDQQEMKPSGSFSHGLGILGASMITIGVAMYSSRKRIRALWSVGKLSSWLEVHIFLCLLGPVLVIYHTTFKAGGIAAISLWTMLSVAASGIVGRFLYVLIPRNVKGNELTERQINEEFDRISAVLRESEIGTQLLRQIDGLFAQIRRPETFGDAIRTFLLLIRLRRRVHRSVRRFIVSQRLPAGSARLLLRAATARVALIQRSLVLIQVERLFYYWHAIHIPFTVMMFVTLAVHISVALWLGYRWIF